MTLARAAAQCRTAVDFSKYCANRFAVFRSLRLGVIFFGCLILAGAPALDAATKKEKKSGRRARGSSAAYVQEPDARVLFQEGMSQPPLIEAGRGQDHFLGDIEHRSSAHTDTAAAASNPSRRFSRAGNLPRVSACFSRSKSAVTTPLPDGNRVST